MEQKRLKVKVCLTDTYCIVLALSIFVYFFQRVLKSLTKTHSFKTACFIQTGRRIFQLVSN